MTLPKQFSEDNTENIRIYHYVEELIGSFKGYVGEMFDDEEITFIESSFLIRIHFLGQCGQNDLIEIFKVSEGHVSRILRKFENLELIERFENPQNHRKKIVRLTDKGRKKAEDILKLMDMWEEKVMGSMDESEKTVLKDSLYKIVSETEKF